MESSNGNGNSAQSAPTGQTRTEDSLLALRRAAEHAHAIEQAAERLGTASREQVTQSELTHTAIEAMGAGLEQASASLSGLARSQQSVAETARTMHASVEASATTTQEIAASIVTMKKDAALLATFERKHRNDPRRGRALDQGCGRERRGACFGKQ